MTCYTEKSTEYGAYLLTIIGLTGIGLLTGLLFELF